MRNKPVRESAIESYFKKLVEAAGGGIAYKFVSPGNPGVADRLVMFPGMVHFVETKQAKGRMRSAQIIQARRMANMGFEVQVIRSKEQAKTWVELNASIAQKMVERKIQ